MADEMAVRLGGNLAQRRNELGLTQAQVAERLDVNTETISRFERGATLPSLQTLDRLANVLHTRMASLVEGVSTKPEELAQELSDVLRPLNDDDRVMLLGMVKQLGKRFTLGSQT